MKKSKSFLWGIVLSVTACFFAPAQASYTETKYPIVLVHGIMGFDSVGSMMYYFHNIPWHLERSGAKVYIPQVSFLHHSEERGIQLKDYILQNVSEAKVNIFAHSQGAPTARVTASLIPERIASITSIHGVNKGSKVADIMRGILPPGSALEGGVAALFTAAGKLVNLLTGSDAPHDAVAALETMTTRGSADLNSRHGWGVNSAQYCGTTPEDVNVYGHNIKMYSWVGYDAFTNLLDLSDYPLQVLNLAFERMDNDGLADRCTQYMGRAVYEYAAMNHFDAVNHLFGITSPFHSMPSLYRSHANRLKNLGL